MSHSGWGRAAAALAAASLASAPALAGDGQRLTLAPVYSDHMVLQRDHAIPVRGTAAPLAQVSIRLGGQQTVTVTADADGAWEAMLPPTGATSGLELAVSSGGDSITLSDLAVGDVFLCSGQSNMEFPLRLATNADSAIAASSHASLRLLNVPRQSSAIPLSDFVSPASWQVSGPDSVRDFSAACYFMGLELGRRRQAPIGLIASSWGGSFIEAWLDQGILAADSRYSSGLALLAQWQADPVAAEQVWLDAMRAYMADNSASDKPAFAADPERVWEEWGVGLVEFDGLARYVTTVELTAEQARDARRIVLGRIDDIDETAINGQPVGMTAAWDIVRDYALPTEALRAGKNRIEVRVLDTGGGGGLYGAGPRAIQLEGGAEIPLAGPWQFHPGRSFTEAGAAPSKPWIPTSGLGTLENGMIAPLGRIPLAGIAWYQGESNASEPAQYARLLPLLMQQWRERFDTRRFAIVQLANFGDLSASPVNSNWAKLREVQRRVVAGDPDAGLATAIDVGDPYDIHPGNKRTVGLRLAAAMEGTDRTEDPMIERASGAVRVSFGRELKLVGGASAIGFELCKRAACRFVNATLTDPRTVVLDAEADDDHIRFLWSSSPITNLFDTVGVPIVPFEAALPASVED